MIIIIIIIIIIIRRAISVSEMTKSLLRHDAKQSKQSNLLCTSGNFHAIRSCQNKDTMK